MKKLISIILIISFLFTLSSCANTVQSDWQEHLDLGQKYLLDGNYEQAIIEFNKVIEIEPKNVDAYLGLAEAYVAAGDYDSAISVLEKGYAETENQALQDKINELRVLTNSQAVAVTTSPEASDGTATTSENIINQEIESQKVKQVSIGGSHAAAITVDGSLYMWGGSMLGNGKYGGSNVPIKIMDNVASISLSRGHSAAITTDGSLYMWGNNYCGQLGNGTSGGSRYEYDEGIDSNIPVKIMDNVVSVSLGDDYSAAITEDGGLYMWGDNCYGQLGNGTSGGSGMEYNDGIDSNVPLKIMDNVVSVSFGDDYSAAITKDGSLYMWGFNGYGQLGNGTTDGQLGMIHKTDAPTKIMDNIVSVSLGSTHSAAITTDGSLYMWGHNVSGQLGNGTNDNSNVPVKIMDNIASVSLKSSSSAAITTDGSLYMWGYNNYGQLGNGKSDSEGNVVHDKSVDSNVPIKIMENVISVNLGGENSVAITSAITTDGSLYTWGGSMLGNGKYGGSNVPIKIMDNVVSVSLGDDYSAAITEDGSLYMWGDNSMGQLGDGTYNISSTYPIKVDIPTE